MIIVDRTELLKALNIASKAVAPKPIIPLFGNMLFDVDGTHAVLSATNFEISLKYELNLIAGDKFVTTLPADTTTKLISNVHDATIVLDMNVLEQHITVITPNSTNRINCMSPDDFPAIASTIQKFITINSTRFKKMVDRVSYAAYHGDEEKVTKGVLLEIEQDKTSSLVMFAVDGFHMSYEDADIENPDDVVAKAIIQATTLESMAKLLDDNMPLSIGFTGNQVTLKCGSLTVVTQLMDGNYPDRKMIVLGTPKIAFKLPTVSILRACKQLEIFANEKGYAILIIKDKMLHIKAITDERGESVINIPINVQADAELRIGLNVYFLREFLDVCFTENTLFQFNTHVNPIVLWMDGFTEHYHIIMPMAV